MEPGGSGYVLWKVFWDDSEKALDSVATEFVKQLNITEEMEVEQHDVVA